MNKPLSSLNKLLGRIPLHVAIIGMCLFWLLVAIPY